MVTDKIAVLRTRSAKLTGEFWLENKGYIDPVKMVTCLTYLSTPLRGKF